MVSKQFFLGTYSDSEYNYLVGGLASVHSIVGLDEEAVEKDYSWDMSSKIISLKHYKKEKYLEALSNIRNIIKFVSGPSSSPKLRGVYVIAREGYTNFTGRPFGNDILLRQKLFA